MNKKKKKDAKGEEGRGGEKGNTRRRKKEKSRREVVRSELRLKRRERNRKVVWYGNLSIKQAGQAVPAAFTIHPPTHLVLVCKPQFLLLFFLRVFSYEMLSDSISH